MQHNIKNRTIFCKDNLDILQGMDSNTIDLIYLDPPFNKKKQFTAPIGSSAEGASFKDWFRLEDVKEEWVESIQQDNENLHNFLLGIKNIDGRHSYNFCYVTYMAIRLIECHRILKHTGSLYLHCDPTMSHYLKIALDCIFGANSFKNEIVWCYKENETATKYFPRKHDIIFFYTKNPSYPFNIQTGDFTEAQLKRYNHIIDGERYANMKGKMRKLKAGAKVRDWWDDIPIAQQSERTGYPTQKPLSLLHRVIKASSNEEDIVLDPFCGCATTCVAAEQLQRQWIGIDISVKAYDLVRSRLEKEVADKGDILKYQNEVYFSTTAPNRTDNGKDYQQQKYVYVISNIAYPNEYKVGIARNVKQRIDSYQTSDPNRGYTLEFHVLTPHYRALEKHIHHTFENKHEWVRANVNDIQQEIQNFLKNKDNTAHIKHEAEHATQY